MHNSSKSLLGDQIKRNEKGMACSKYGSKEWCYRNLVEKPELKRTCGRSRRITLNWTIMEEGRVHVQDLSGSG